MRHWRVAALTILISVILVFGSSLVKGTLAQNNAVYYFEVNENARVFSVYQPVDPSSTDLSNVVAVNYQILSGSVRSYSVASEQFWRSDGIVALLPDGSHVYPFKAESKSRFLYFAQGFWPAGDVNVFSDPFAPLKRGWVTSWVAGYVVGVTNWDGLANINLIDSSGRRGDTTLMQGYIVVLVQPGGGYLKYYDVGGAEWKNFNDKRDPQSPISVVIVPKDALRFVYATVTPVPPTSTPRPWPTYTPASATPTPLAQGEVSGETPQGYVDVVAGIQDLKTPDLWDFMAAKVKENVTGLDTTYAIDLKVQEVYLVTKRDFGSIALAPLFGRAVIIPDRTKIRIPLFNTSILAQAPPGQVPQRPQVQVPQGQPSTGAEGQQQAGAWTLVDITAEARELCGMYVSERTMNKPLDTRMIVLHDTGARAIPILSIVRADCASSRVRMIPYHIIIDTDGTPYLVQNFEYQTHHVGDCAKAFGPEANCNPYALGVSLNGMDAYPAQRQSLKLVTAWRMQKNGLRAEYVYAHHEIDAKQDPQHIDMDEFRRELASIGLVSDPVIIDAQGNRQSSVPGLTSGNTNSGSTGNSGGAASGSPNQLGIAWMPWTVTRWEKLIIEKSRAYGVDPKLTAVIMAVESCGNPQAVSGSGAVGLMQVMDYNANGRDLYHPSENLEAGLSYLAQMYQQFNDWAWAVVAYNDGPGNVSRGTISSEGRRYYSYVVGMWQEVGLAQSSAVNTWLREQGASLCRQAESSPGPEQWRLQ